MGDVDAMLPHNGREEAWFKTLSVTAGVCEEVIYRGFLMAYFTAVTNTVAAVIGSSLVFGLAHAYQGGRGLLKAAIVGALMAGLYLLTGSLWVPMVVHAAMDLGIAAARRISLQDAGSEPVAGNLASSA